jgi:hypothetical protein
MLRLHRPSVHQNGRPIRGEFRALAGGHIGFLLGAYRRQMAVTIDPGIS